ncbi:ABC transporter permease subunit [Clostridium sp. MCC353]|uniref:carbohydrate ABC transporter permease n=1 Tax=Clostridium sp. MCC353 TaxID=2592646 RepID=UPI001C011A8D|nr:sugar ABC transporter permease [Clostridium sp. MCC353]MBT9777302.1 ABC transporter permease subunit [Clostridium sp. MCC353]
MKGKKLFHSRKFVNAVTPYLFVGPAVLIILTFLVVPALMALGYSFTYFNMLKPQKIRFVGLENYAGLFSADLFATAMVNTVKYAVVLVPVVCVVSFLLALLVNQNLRGSTLFRTAFFSPVLLSMTVVSILWTVILNPTPGYGLINTILDKMGLPGCMFLRSAETALNSILGMSVWQLSGYYMMIFLAGLQGVPGDLYEAASIDGANALDKIIHITIPSIRNVSVFVILMTTISAMKMFTQSYVMTNGGPDNSTTTMVFYIYQQGIKYHNIGFASAASVVFFFIVVSISFIVKRFVDNEN